MMADTGRAIGKLFEEKPSILEIKGMNPIKGLKSPEIYTALRHQVVQRLMNAIFVGELPAGTQLIVMKLAKHFGLSTTPVREAFLELEAVGLIRFEHNRGAIVNPFGKEELRQIFQLRRILEAEAARAACGRIDKEILKTILRERRQLFESRRDEPWVEREMASDRQLHELITASCGSGRLAREIRRYDILVQALRDATYEKNRTQEYPPDDHVAIIDALLADDPETARLKMAEHIDHAVDLVEAAIFSPKNQGKRCAGRKEISQSAATSDE
jgi:GntR family transcriptional regulator, rspAB operon transcriptional repressor